MDLTDLFSDWASNTVFFVWINSLLSSSRGIIVLSIHCVISPSAFCNIQKESFTFCATFSIAHLLRLISCTIATIFLDFWSIFFFNLLLSISLWCFWESFFCNFWYFCSSLLIFSIRERTLFLWCSSSISVSSSSKSFTTSLTDILSDLSFSPMDRISLIIMGVLKTPSAISFSPSSMRFRILTSS